MGRQPQELGSAPSPAAPAPAQGDVVVDGGVAVQVDRPRDDRAEDPAVAVDEHRALGCIHGAHDARIRVEEDVPDPAR